MTGRARFAILQRDGFACQFCGAVPGNDRLRVIHVLPPSKRGTDAPENLITACDRCADGKGNKTTVPSRLLAEPTPDCDGWVIWKRFGPWSVETHPVAGDEQYPSGVIINFARLEYWFPVERAYENDWEEHVGRKTWGTAEVMAGLSDALSFARAICAHRKRRLERPLHSSHDHTNATARGGRSG